MRYLRRRALLALVVALLVVPGIARATCSDTTPPDTTLTGKPPDPTTSTSATFTFAGTDDVGVKGFECSIDFGAWTPCSSPKTYSGLSLSRHAFGVRAVDAAGHVDPTHESWAWTITAPPPPRIIVGANGAWGYGKTDAAIVLRDGIKSTRVDMDPGIQGGIGPREAFDDGFRNLVALVGNTPDGTKLDQIDQAAWLTEATRQLKAGLTLGIRLFEVVNEPYYKGTMSLSEGSRPDVYAKLYASLRRQNLGGTLLFDAFGDYFNAATGRWSQDANGGGWFRSAIAAVPDLPSLVDGFSFHSYGPVGYNYADESGEGAMESLHALAGQLGFVHRDFYVPEMGFHIGGKNDASYVPDGATQATKYRDELARMASLGWVKGVWPYQIHDDGSGAWGLISADNPWTPRPAYQVVVDFSKAYG